MKMTLDIDEMLLERLREVAAQRGTTMSALVETGIKCVISLKTSSGEQHGALPFLPTWHSGGSRIDISNREELYRIMAQD